MRIYYLPKFAKQYKKLPLAIKIQAEKKEKIFRKNPFDKSLKTHKLKGELEGFWSFSVNYSYRIIFDFLPRRLARTTPSRARQAGKDEKTVRFYFIGDHSIYN